MFISFTDVGHGFENYTNTSLLVLGDPVLLTFKASKYKYSKFKVTNRTEEVDNGTTVLTEVPWDMERTNITHTL